MKSSLLRYGGALAVIAVIAVIALSATMAFGKTTGWSEDYAKSIARAKSEKKLVLLDFTGSDWCVWCMELDKEVFSTRAFQSYAKDHLVLVKADFPQEKAQTNKIKAQNEKLRVKFNIDEFPTVLVLNPAGKPVGQLGYMDGGPKPFIAALKKLKK